ncbi:DUF732 domain-containing protein [Mycobacterium sp. IDR2000157661]|uniref:DUF732 domain-containing protein n=1 Tax=Mycobacterium sp. IDR2000157661 TaxID=2867005 RepID=UPI001EEEFEF0|nr:DUF732 domain-containing protein [Mycobacterium sp. IDR2000157661]ULE34662.1 hypothetical protein K3G64_08735 [Mycobacterium sp. IDR2000157661]
MRRTGSLWLAAAALAASALATASPATAQDADYLWLLQDRYRFLTPEQLLSEGYKVCAVIEQGVGSRYAAEMVQQDLGVSPGGAMDIVSAATVELGC